MFKSTKEIEERCVTNFYLKKRKTLALYALSAKTPCVTSQARTRTSSLSFAQHAYSRSVVLPAACRRTPRKEGGRADGGVDQWMGAEVRKDIGADGAVVAC